MPNDIATLANQPKRPGQVTHLRRQDRASGGAPKGRAGAGTGSRDERLYVVFSDAALHTGTPNFRQIDIQLSGDAPD